MMQAFLYASAITMEQGKTFAKHVGLFEKQFGKSKIILQKH